jgi:hypothetical protein
MIASAEVIPASGFGNARDKHPKKWRPGYPPSPVKNRPASLERLIFTVNPVAQWDDIAGIVSAHPETNNRLIFMQ